MLSDKDVGEECWDTGTNFVAGRYSLLFLISDSSSSAKSITHQIPTFIYLVKTYAGTNGSNMTQSYIVSSK